MRGVKGNGHAAVVVAQSFLRKENQRSGIGHSSLVEGPPAELRSAWTAEGSRPHVVLSAAGEKQVHERGAPHFASLLRFHNLTYKHSEAVHISVCFSRRFHLRGRVEG